MINTVPLSYRTTITERNMHPEAFLDARPYARKRVANIDEAIDTYYHLRFHQSEQFDHVDHFGGGTFGLSNYHQEGRLKVIVVDGDTHLGGEDFDNRMVEHFVSQFKRMHKKYITKTTQNERKALGRLRVASEKAKQTQSSANFTAIEIDCLYDGVDFLSKKFRDKFIES
ncbi:heat shock cognate 70 kDa protein 2-like protein [Tanacetum coccineum]